VRRRGTVPLPGVAITLTPRCTRSPAFDLVARKPATRVEFTLFDVVYEDGSLRSNRKVPSDVLSGPDGDAAARAVIEEQDRIIAEKSGNPAVGVKSIHRSRSRNGGVLASPNCKV
jgi:hypothetical protein